MRLSIAKRMAHCRERESECGGAIPSRHQLWLHVRLTHHPWTVASAHEGGAGTAMAGKALSPASLLPGMVIGFLLGLWVELPKGGFRGSSVPAKKGGVGSRSVSSPSDEGVELKMVFVVRQDLKMGSGKIASQCAHAATGIYNELLSRNRALLKRWEDCGQPKIVVTCKNQKEMNELRGKADGAGLPTYTVADAGRTQVAAGSKTVLVIGPGSKTSVDSVTRHLRLL